jgi:hypothetical protein
VGRPSRPDGFEKRSVESITVWQSADVFPRDPGEGITVDLDRLLWIRKLVLSGARVRPRQFPG